MRETQGEAVSRVEMFNKVHLFAEARQLKTAEGNRFKGKVSRKNHGIKKWESGVTACAKVLSAGTSLDVCRPAAAPLPC